MAIATFNKKIFEKEIGKINEELQNKIAMFGTPVEKVSDDEIEIEVFPNRPDLLSYQGFKRSFLGFLGKTKGMKKYLLNSPEKDFEVLIDSSLKNIRPFTACAIVKELKFDDEKIKEIIDIQEKLHATVGRKRKKLAIGIYPLEKIKLPITFKALEPDKIKFIPLEMNREFSGLEILQRHPTGRDYAHLLAGKEKFPIFIDADNQILSMPPIINSHQTGKITNETKEVFIECSGFDFEILKKCLNIIVTTLIDMGGKAYQMKLSGAYKEITPNLNPEKMNLSSINANKLLGLNLNEKEIKNLIEKMGYNYDKDFVEIPAWRTDVLHEVDLIEDIAIAYGYENFEPAIPEISTIGEENSEEKIKRKISNIFSGLGFLEISNLHLSNVKDQFLKMGFSEKNLPEFIELEESKTDYKILRKDLSHYLMKVFSENVDSEYPQKIFETGKVFELIDNKIVEKEKLSVGISPGNFTELKQVLEYFSRMLELNLELKEPEKEIPWFIDGRIAEIILNEKIIGFIGEVHPKILKNWKIKMPVVLLELDLKEILEK